MVYDLRLNNKFFVSKDIFFDTSISRKARAIYVALSFLIMFREKPSLIYIARASGYNPQVVSKALKELKELGFIKKSKKFIDLIK